MVTSKKKQGGNNEKTKSPHKQRNVLADATDAGGADKTVSYSSKGERSHERKSY